MADNEILGIGRFTFHEGKLEEFKRLSAQVMQIVETDTGTLQYDIYLNDEESQGVVVELYQDSSALMRHAEDVGPLIGAIFATAAVESVMLGEPSEEVRAAIAGSGVRLFTPFLSLPAD